VILKITGTDTNQTFEVVEENCKRGFQSVSFTLSLLALTSEWLTHYSLAWCYVFLAEVHQNITGR